MAADIHALLRQELARGARCLGPTVYLTTGEAETLGPQWAQPWSDAGDYRMRMVADPGPTGRRCSALRGDGQCALLDRCPAACRGKGGGA